MRRIVATLARSSSSSSSSYSCVKLAAASLTRTPASPLALLQHGFATITASTTTPSKEEHYRAKYQEVLTALGGNLTQAAARSLAGAEGASSSSSAAAPPLAPAKVLQAAKQSSKDLLGQSDPPLSPKALLFLGDLFWSGLQTPGVDIPQDQEKAAALWRAAGERGDEEGTYNYANCLLFGSGAAEDRSQAQVLLNELAEKGHAQASYSLGVLLTAAHQRQQQQQQQQQHQQQQQQQSSSSSSSSSSSKPLRREKEEENAVVRIYDLLCCAVKGGVVPAIHNLGNLLAEGRSPRVPRDDEAALELYSAGAELGDPMSIYTLATWLCQGRGGEEDWDRGFELHRQAAGMGMPQAMYNTATHYFAGRGVEQDMAQAAHWFQVAAEAGFSKAMINLGNMHLEGLAPVPPAGVAPVDEARRWFEKAEVAGDSAAKEGLAKCDAAVAAAAKEGKVEGEEGKGTK